MQRELGKDEWTNEEHSLTIYYECVMHELWGLGGRALNPSKVVFPDKDMIAQFCRERHIHRLAVFGSVLREDFDPQSDIDILVEFEHGHVPGFFRLFEVEEELSRLFGGRRVDLRTPEDLSRYFRSEVLAHAEVQYARE